MEVSRDVSGRYKGLTNLRINSKKNFKITFAQGDKNAVSYFLVIEENDAISVLLLTTNMLL